MGFALVKGERPEWVTQKLTELGIDVIVPFVAARSVVRWDAPQGRRQPRAPRAHRPGGVDAVPTCLAADGRAAERPLPTSSHVQARCSPKAVRHPLSSDARLVLIGPEGGWSTDELAARTGDRGPRRARAAGRDGRRGRGHAAGGRSGRAAMSAEQDATFGVYVHIPFCRHRCDYCAFATWTDRTGSDRPLPRRLRATQAAADLRRCAAVTSVFFGGGTPSLVDPEHLARLIGAIGAAPGAEVTVECNPDDVTPTLLRAPTPTVASTACRFGVQSMVPHVLAALGRTHDPDNVRAGRRLAADEVGFALQPRPHLRRAGRDARDWQATLDGALALDAGARQRVRADGRGGHAARRRSPTATPTTTTRPTSTCSPTTCSAPPGFEWYEISNWAQPGHECRHNLLYWTRGDYLAVGCAAHGHRGGRRWWNVRTPERYIDAIEAGRSPVAADERLDADAHRLEALALLVAHRCGRAAGRPRPRGWWTACWAAWSAASSTWRPSGAWATASASC